MRFVLAVGPSREVTSAFLLRNGIEDFEVKDSNEGLVVEIGEQGLTPQERRVLARHFSSYDLFGWVPNGMEGVRFWEEPERLGDVFRELDAFFDTACYDVVATIGARGFILAGALCFASGKPLVPIRKYKADYQDSEGHKSASYCNWKGEEEAPFLFDAAHFSGAQALFVDDVLETGNSMRAAVGLLEGDGISVQGAFFLFDAAHPEVRENLDFPVRSLLRCYELLENTAPAM